LAWISSTIPPMITGLGSTSARLLNGFCKQGGSRERKSGKQKGNQGRAVRRHLQGEAARVKAEGGDGGRPPSAGWRARPCRKRLGFFRGRRRLFGCAGKRIRGFLLPLAVAHARFTKPVKPVGLPKPTGCGFG
jgi:hypothetical protein